MIIVFPGKYSAKIIYKKTVGSVCRPVALMRRQDWYGSAGRIKYGFCLHTLGL